VQPNQYGSHSIVQAATRCLPTMVARVQAKVRSCGICGGQNGTGACFLQVLWFPLPIFIPSIAPQSPSSIIWGWYNRPIVAAVPSLTPQRISILSRAQLIELVPPGLEIGTSSIDWAQLSRFYLKMERGSSLQKCALNKKQDGVLN
jgi:hypothetical protein